VVVFSTSLVYDMAMITEYIQKSLAKARFEKLKDGTYYAHIPGIRGVWANAKTKTETRKELHEILEEWLFMSAVDRQPVRGLSFPYLKHRLAHA